MDFVDASASQDRHDGERRRPVDVCEWVGSEETDVTTTTNVEPGSSVTRSKAAALAVLAVTSH